MPTRPTASIPQLEIGLAQSQNALSTLLGQPTGSVQSLLHGPQTIPTAPSQEAGSIPAERLRRRPDIRSAELTAMSRYMRVSTLDQHPETQLYDLCQLVSQRGLLLCRFVRVSLS